MIFWMVFDGILIFLIGVLFDQVATMLAARLRVRRIIRKVQEEADIECMKRNVQKKMEN